jgi:hypothetical protein
MKFLLLVPTLLVHHKQDGCELCRYGDLPKLMDKLSAVPRKELFTFEGGRSRPRTDIAAVIPLFRASEPYAQSARDRKNGS